MAMKLFVAATRKNDGKTIVSLGLLSALRKRVKKIGYMKPVGQQFRIVDGKMIDKDAILMQKIFGFHYELSCMNPIAIPEGFTEDYIRHGDAETVRRKVSRAYQRLARGHDFVLIEGTGHAGVGSVFDLSNADVAELLGAKVILVSGGGIGKPIDEIMLNRAKFDAQGVDVLGVVVNQVRKDKYPKINRMIRKGLARKQTEVLGVIPFEEVLSNPTVSELLDDLHGQLLCGERGLNNIVERFVIGDVVAYQALDYLASGTLLIIPGNREDFIFSALSGWVLGLSKRYNVSGIVATYGIKPSKKMMDVVARANIPLILVRESSFATARAISHMIFNLRAEDVEKIRKTETLIEHYVDIDRILQLLRGK